MLAFVREQEFELSAKGQTSPHPRWQTRRAELLRHEGLVAYYTFDRKTADNAALSQPGKIDGLLDGNGGSKPAWVSGPWPGSSALSFNGTSDWVRLEGGSTGTPTSSLASETFTLAVWFRAGDGGTPGRFASATLQDQGRSGVALLSKGAAESDGQGSDSTFFLGILKSNQDPTLDGRLAIDFEDDADGTNHFVFGKTRIRPNTWHFAAATYDGETLRLYLDGKLEGERKTGGATPQLQTNAPGVIGGAILSGGSPTALFNGHIREVAIFDQPLTQEDIDNIQSISSD